MSFRWRDAEPTLDPCRLFYPNPVHQHTDGWYFYDESWKRETGPFPTKIACLEALVVYCKEEL